MATFIQTITKSVKHWYIPLIIGIILIAVGIYVFTMPLETYLTLSVLFSISFIFKGVLDIYFSIENRKIFQEWGWYLVGGLLSLACGIILSIYPGISMVILPFVVGFTLLFFSFHLLGFAFEMKNFGILNWGYAALLSVFGVIFSFMLIVSPLIAGISLVTITGVSFMFIGTSSIVLSFNLRKVKKIPEKLSSELKNRISDIKKEIDQVYAGS
ncbi:MAG TPA: DUF308 domain-containing protein [Prolixibacteraceae bacterium]|nr:DUF308 domain-containing protein [Prolixibacteraceae bacterium]